MKIVFWANGSTIFDEDGYQIPSLQNSWLHMYLKDLEDRGIAITSDTLITLPNGQKVVWNRDNVVEYLLMIAG